VHAASVSYATGKQDKAILLVVADNAVMGGAWDLNEIWKSVLLLRLSGSGQYEHG
jgi:hypothetical protein